VRPKVVADATAAAATGIAEAEGRLAAQVDAYLSARAEAERLIEAMPEGNGRLVLYLWYVVGMKPRAIAKRMGYSADHVFRLHRLAIKELSKIAKDASKCQ
jgi:DNA-directed RNA polymerase specialized sigma subunit